MSCSTQFKDATLLFIEQMDVIKRLVQKYPDDMVFVTTAEGLNTEITLLINVLSTHLSILGIEQAFKEKRIASMIGVESGHAVSSSLGGLRSLYELGARYMTLTHSCNTPW